jgi:hypothetical protein
MAVKTVVQVTANMPYPSELERWVDIMDLPETVNDLRGFLEVAKKDFDGRKTRIVQILEE